MLCTYANHGLHELHESLQLFEQQKKSRPNLAGMSSGGVWFPLFVAGHFFVGGFIIVLTDWNGKIVCVGKPQGFFHRDRAL